MRKYPNSEGKLWLGPGDYGQNPEDGKWYARPPGEDSHMCCLDGHMVTEHNDGTISVTPSVLITMEEGDSEYMWHGWLVYGTWREITH